MRFNIRTFLQKVDAFALLYGLYMALLMVALVAMMADFSLSQASTLYLSRATLDGVDISERVKWYYRFLEVFSLSFILFYIVFYRVSAKMDGLQSMLAPLASLGIVAVVGASMHLDQLPDVFYVFVPFCLITICGLIVRDPQKLAQSFTKAAIPSFLIFTAILFLCNDSFGKSWHIYGLLILIFLGLSLVFYSSQSHSVEQLYKALLPLVAVPFVLFFAVEFALGAKASQWSFAAYYKQLFCGIMVLKFLGSYLVRNTNFYKKIEVNIDAFYGVSFVVALVLMVFYKPIIEQPKEMFEMANPANAVMSLWQFGLVPNIDFMSSHMLSEQIFGAIHTMIFGYDGNLSFMSYAFFNVLFFYLLLYFFLAKIFQPSILAGLFLLFFPFLAYLITSNLLVGIVLFYTAYRLLEKPFTSSYLLFYATIILMILWRLDIGISGLLASVLYVVLNLGLGLAEVNRPSLIRSVVIALLSVGGILALVMVIWSPAYIKEHFLNAYYYIVANQAHGLSAIANANDQGVARVFFLFLLMSVLAVFYQYYQLIRGNILDARHQLLRHASIFFFLIHLFNFQRGLVRHSLVNGSDNFLTSTFFLATALLVVSIFYNYSVTKRYVVFVFAAFFSLFLLKYSPLEDTLGNVVPLVEDNSLQHFDAKFKDPRLKIKVLEDSTFIKNTFGDLKWFLDHNLSPDQSFLDFSNTPMLYYWCKRKVPSYFCQSQQNAIGDYLQLSHLAKVKKADIPVVLYSNYPLYWGDHIDEVPNSLRQYLLAEYIYRTYSPYSVINGHSVWLKRGFVPKLAMNAVADTLIDKPVTYDYAKAGPMVYDFIRSNPKDHVLVKTWQPNHTDQTYDIRDLYNTENGLWLHLAIEPVNDVQRLDVEILDENNQLLGKNSMEVVPYVAHYATRLTNHFLWYTHKPTHIRLIKNATTTIKTLSVYKDLRS